MLLKQQIDYNTQKGWMKQGHCEQHQNYNLQETDLRGNPGQDG
jgi:hypothetical protein